MEINIRESRPEDAPACGEICFAAFKTIADKHNFPSDFPSVDIATSMLAGLIAHPSFYGIVAEIDGKVVGSNFLDERSSLAGLGPVTVSPSIQNKAIGKELMISMMDRVKEKDFSGVRLLQAAYNYGSLSLYAKLGFNVQASFAVMQGAPIQAGILGHSVRPVSEQDLAACNALCLNIHGHDRAGELSDAMSQNTASLVEHKQRIVGYSTGLTFFGHSVAETNDGLKALISSASKFHGPGIIIPTANSELFAWCLQNKLRVVQAMNLMTKGFYKEPKGAYMASVLY